MTIRIATSDDFDSIWPIIQAIVAAGDTYAYPPDMTKQQAMSTWLHEPERTYVCIRDGRILGTYYLKPNAAGPGSHVCNCGYMVAAQARGLGIATAMCEHSQAQALALGYKAMQFNFVASSNTGAIHLWHKLGFTSVGRLPQAFNHPTQGYIDALVMYKWLAA